MQASARRWFPFLIPPLYLALIVWLQPPDRLGPPDWPAWLDRAAYDDYDIAAMTLRALNTGLRREAGRLDPPPPLGVEGFREALDAGPPLRPRYFLEWPHTALWLFRLNWFLAGGSEGLDPPTAVCDGSYHDVVEHEPHNDAEQALWRRFRLADQIHRAFMTVCLLALTAVLARGYEPGGGLVGEPLFLLLPAALYFSLNRFDVLPAALTALSLAGLGRGRLTVSAVCLALATLVKVYPLLLAPLVMRYLSDRRGPMVRWTLGYALCLAAVLGPLLAVHGWEAVAGPYRFQTSRSAEIGWTFYLFVLPPVLASEHPAAALLRVALVGLVVVGLVRSRPQDLRDLLRRAAVVLLVFVALQVFFSPQWILWLAPLLVPLATADRQLARIWIALDLVTFLSFPLVYDLAGQPPAPVLRVVLVYARAGLVLALLARLTVRADRPCPVPGPLAVSAA
jgi:hypothetical protein